MIENVILWIASSNPSLLRNKLWTVNPTKIQLIQSSIKITLTKETKTAKKKPDKLIPQLKITAISLSKKSKIFYNSLRTISQRDLQKVWLLRPMTIWVWIETIGLIKWCLPFKEWTIDIKIAIGDLLNKWTMIAIQRHRVDRFGSHLPCTMEDIRMLLWREEGEVDLLSSVINKCPSKLLCTWIWMEGKILWIYKRKIEIKSWLRFFCREVIVYHLLVRL